MTENSQARLSYEESCRLLQRLGYVEEGAIPPMPNRMPQPADPEPLGVEFFRTYLGDGVDLSNFTLPRTFFGRSEVSGVKFRNSDLSESDLRWNDFLDVDFSYASLARCDLRASVFTKVKFTSADLSNSDLRRSIFKECVFSDANMKGVLLARKQEAGLRLSPLQRNVIAWFDDDDLDLPGG